jgi:hypothetical protein
MDATYDASAMEFTRQAVSFGTVNAVIESDGTLTASIANIPGGLITRVDVSGTVTTNRLTANYTVRFAAGATATGTLNLAK